MIVYKATNVETGQAFIGLSNSIEEAQAQALDLANQSITDFRFRRAIAEFTIDAFVWEILKSPATSTDEQFFIDDHGTSYPEGYNTFESAPAPQTPASEESPSSPPLRVRNRVSASKATKQKMSAKRKGVPKSEAHKLAISKGHATHKESGLFYQSEEYKAKMRKAQTGKTRSEATKEKLRLASLKRWYPDLYK